MHMGTYHTQAARPRRLDTYHIQDARELTKVVNSGVDLIVTSPPYFDMKDYGPENQIGFGQSI